MSSGRSHDTMIAPEGPEDPGAAGLPPAVGRRMTRGRLVERLAAAGDAPLVLVEAPPGYGKTSVLSDWLRSELGRRRFAWLSLGPRDADPRRLLALLIGAVRQRFATFDCRVGPLLPESGTGRAVDEATPRFLDELARLPSPLVIVLDDFHRLRGTRAHHLLETLASGLPRHVQLAIATRDDPRLPLARRRAGDALVELRVPDLRFDRDEVAALLTAAGAGLDDETARLVAHDLLVATEGWPAGVALALQALRREDDPVSFARRFGGTHRDIRDYVDEEVLRHLAPALRTFLVRTSVLGRMTGSLCDAVLDGSGSQAILEQIERDGIFVVPLDDERRWYRYQRPFLDVLRAELARSRPELVADLHRRASAWFDACGARHEAADHALAALRLGARPRRRHRHTAIVPPDPPVTTAGNGSRVGQGLDFGQHLTDRELTILRLLRTRLSQREIAAELFVSVNTVKTHSRAIYRKLGVSSRQEATDRARELELLGGPAAAAR